MKTIEATISLLIFLSMAIHFIPAEREIDDSLYKTQLVNDVWRLFSLRGGLEDFDKKKMNADAERITELTKLCIEFEEEDVTTCIPKENIIQTKKTAIINGKPTTITLRIGN